MIIKIKHNKEIFAYLIKYTKKKGVNFFTPKSVGQQVAIINHSKGHKIKPHIHFKNHRSVKYTTEVLIIKKGKLRVDFYKKNKLYLFSKILKKDNIIIFIKGGHGFEVLENSSIIEIKQGPYNKTKDKLVFENYKSKRKYLK